MSLVSLEHVISGEIQFLWGYPGIIDTFVTIDPE